MYKFRVCTILVESNVLHILYSNSTELNYDKQLK